MQLEDGFYDVPPGKIAAVVTELEMTAPAPPRGRAAPDGITLRHVDTPDPDWYRRLFAHVGTDWLWFSRMQLSDTALTDILSSPQVDVYAAETQGEPQGLLELDFRTAGECELAFFGLGAGLIGSGAGSWMMDEAIARAWQHPITRFHVHTCTLDHPSALGFYMRSGFQPTGRKIEIADDPRKTGDLPGTAAPNVPVL